MIDDVELKATKFMEDLNVAISNIPAKLTTMTVFIEFEGLNMEFLNLQRIQEGFKNPQVLDIISSITGDSSIVLSKRRTFFNSLVFKCRNKESVKLFCNGNIHVTGVKTILDAIALADVFAILINSLYGITEGRRDKPYDIPIKFKYDVQLINIAYVIPGITKKQRMDLERVQTELKSKTPYSVSYNTERHAGVILRSPEFSILVFESGNVIISSIKTLEQVCQVSDFITRFINPLPGVCKLCLDKETVGNMKKGFDYKSYLLLK
jgi:TATA-box binding protein (TBP) (component of TFIID and TFIIIB)